MFLHKGQTAICSAGWWVRRKVRWGSGKHVSNVGLLKTSDCSGEELAVQSLRGIVIS